jgi:CDP-6-deoxy-D-xylo-4-hexulose-3-dehydrase
VTKLEAAISPKTKAIMLAHTLGNPFDLDVITAICKKYGLWLIEDCCDALGSTYNGKMVGTFGDIGTCPSTLRTTSPWAKAARYSPTIRN